MIAANNVSGSSFSHCRSHHPYLPVSTKRLPRGHRRRRSSTRYDSRIAKFSDTRFQQWWSSFPVSTYVGCSIQLPRKGRMPAAPCRPILASFAATGARHVNDQVFFRQSRRSSGAASFIFLSSQWYGKLMFKSLTSPSAGRACSASWARMGPSGALILRPRPDSLPLRNSAPEQNGMHL